jgi:hypothetical protein
VYEYARLRAYEPRNKHEAEILDSSFPRFLASFYLPYKVKPEAFFFVRFHGYGSVGGPVRLEQGFNVLA